VMKRLGRSWDGWLGMSRIWCYNEMGYGSCICRTFRLMRLPLIHPLQCSYSFSSYSDDDVHGQSSIHIGHVPAMTCGMLCHAVRAAPDMTTASPDLSLIVTAFVPASSPPSPSSPTTKIPSQPSDMLTSGRLHSSLTSRCRLSVSPGL